MFINEIALKDKGNILFYIGQCFFPLSLCPKYTCAIIIAIAIYSVQQLTIEPAAYILHDYM